MDWPLFLAVLITIESGGNPNAVGDLDLKMKAYGVLQVRQIYLDDVNRVAGTNVTMDQVRRSEGVSRWCAVTYIKHYGARYERITGKPLTMEVAARIHNGGPNGWRKQSTDAHWARFRTELARRNR